MKVKLNLKNKFYYSGIVVDEDDNYINIIDINGNNVTILKSEILIRENICEKEK